ncbi:NADP-dependent oxidoreductase [Nocardia sp. NPDC056000]|uniref:NADP-dependent oxidoreductase n=1 Tax=Nocardia sp. NPDC056000 TaxID=3345674 RepID=UPI0035D6E756
MPTNDTMRAVIARGYGGPDVLELVRVRIPDPGPGQVLIRVHAATVNPVDLLTRSGALADAGLMTPRETTGIGWDVAGVVEAVGPDSSDTPTPFVVGQNVIGLRDLLDRALGTYADYVVLDACAVAPAPDLDPIAAATLPLNGLTAAQSLDLLALSEGDTLLITGAAGAVGGFAVELAARRGLRVLAHAHPADEAFLRAAGAEALVPRDTHDLSAAIRALIPGGAHGALDAAGLGMAAVAAVRTRGAYVAVAGGTPPIPLRGIRIHQQWISADGPALAGIAATGLTPRIAATLPLEHAAEAHRRMERGGLRGRVVLIP